MKANLENFVKVLNARFDGKVKVKMFRNDEEVADVKGVNLAMDDFQIGVFNIDVPTIADVRTIVNTFFSNSNRMIHVDNFWGFIDIFVSEGEMRKAIDDVSLEMIKMILPKDKAQLIK